MNKIAILYICTGDYVCFWKGFYESMNKYFLKNSDIHYYVFTDADTIAYGENNDHVHMIYQENLGWPNNTLHRFKMFKTIENELKNYDYIFFFNSNYVCLEEISEEEFLPKKNQLLVTKHPGYYNCPTFYMPYDRNPKSKAYVPYISLKAHYYFCGGLNGGGAKRYLKLINDLNNQVEIDENNDQVALWHDESHLNRYMINQRNYKILDPSYATPEESELPFKARMLLLCKEKYLPSYSKNNKISSSYQKTPGRYEKTIGSILSLIRYKMDRLFG